jgi:2-hydroxy-3-keto-5-methylthiopentenyl-1-phosphate phosphatase
MSEMNNVYYEKLVDSFKMQEEVYLSDLIFPMQTPEFRIMSETFSNEANEELTNLLNKIYKLEILEYFDLFKEYCYDNYIHPVEVLAMKNDIRAFTDDKAKNLTRQFARTERITIVPIDSEEFSIKKYNRFILKGQKNIMFGIDKRFNFNDLGKYFAHLGSDFYEFVPQKSKIYQKSNDI